MARFIRMPSVMANATDAVLSQWLTSAGKRIAVGDPLAEIETDKAVVEYAAEVEGTVGRLLVEAGARVVVGDPIAVVLEEGEAASAVPVEAEDAAEAGPGAAVAPSGEPAAAERGVREPAAEEHAGRRLFASPIARRVAAQRGIEITLLTGTGPNGRIVRRDVDSYGAAPAGAAPDARAAPTPGTGGAHRDVPLSGMRRAIAQRLTESKSTVPHFYVTAHVRADRLLALRQELNVSSPRKISVNDLVVKAVAQAMIEQPAANAIWNGDSIRYFESVDVAVAVAVTGGLLTPVVRGVERLGLVELSTRIADLAGGARSGRLQQHQLEGGSFTVSNLGMHGVDEFTAIINPPQAGILAVAAAKTRPLVGPDGRLAVGNVMTLTLSADHRVIDGTLAADWIAALVNRLESPGSLLV